MQATRYLATLLLISASLACGQASANPASAPVPAKPETQAEPALSPTAARELARKSTCFNCHSIEVDDIGPAWKNVAAKYRGNPNAEAMLVNKVTRGGKGVWGYLPMPSFASKLREEEIRALVRYILSLK